MGTNKQRIKPGDNQSRTSKSNKRWTEFLDFCNKHARANFWFRGVSDAKYKLIPKIGRGHDGVGWFKTITEGRARINLAERELRLFKAFRRRARLGLQFIPETDFEWLALAQHHGVPTRLLDWTTNPLMAAWFATNSSKSEKPQVARLYAAKVSPIDLVDETVDPFNLKSDSPRFVVSPHWHMRVRAQRGCFSIHPVPNESFDLNKLSWFDIEQEQWREFRCRLFYFGVDASTVMADLSGLGEALAWQYENRIGTGRVGY